MVIAAADVERWVQPDLIEKKTVGDALVHLEGAGESQVAGIGLAQIVTDCRFPTAVAVSGLATAALIAPDTFSPLVRADAVVDVEAWATTLDYHAAAGIASVVLAGEAATAVQLYGDSLFQVLDRSALSVVVEGDAEVAFGDFGMDVPIFPVTFPFQFTDTALLPVGDADIVLDNTGTVDAVEVFGDAVVRLTSNSRLSFQGSIPVFPFGFPIVFDNEATVRVAGAFVPEPVGSAPVAVEVTGDAVVEIDSDTVSVNVSVFPFRFPFVFDVTGYGLAAAVVEFGDQPCPVVVELDADAAVSVSSVLSVDSSAVFPWTFGVIFMSDVG